MPALDPSPNHPKGAGGGSGGGAGGAGAGETPGILPAGAGGWYPSGDS